MHAIRATAGSLLVVYHVLWHAYRLWFAPLTWPDEEHCLQLVCIQTMTCVLGDSFEIMHTRLDYFHSMRKRSLIFHHANWSWLQLMSWQYLMSNKLNFRFGVLLSASILPCSVCLIVILLYMSTLSKLFVVVCLMILCRFLQNPAVCVHAVFVLSLMAGIAICLTMCVIFDVRNYCNKLSFGFITMLSKRFPIAGLTFDSMFVRQSWARCQHCLSVL